MNPIDSIERVSQANEMRKAAEESRDNKALREACGAVEGMFLTLLLKEGLRPGLEEESKAGRSGPLMDLAIEQTAQAIGESGGMGVAESLLQQLGDNW